MEGGGGDGEGGGGGREGRGVKGKPVCNIHVMSFFSPSLLLQARVCALR